MIGDFLRDVKYALRSFVRRPLFTGVILLTLALGIGSNIEMFGVANAVLFRPLPFKDPDQLAFVWTRLAATNVARSLVSGPDFKDYRTRPPNSTPSPARLRSPVRSPATGRRSGSPTPT